MSYSFATPWTVAHQASLPMGIPRQEHWSGLSFHSPGNSPNPGIQPASPAQQVDSLPSKPPGNTQGLVQMTQCGDKAALSNLWNSSCSSHLWMFTNRCACKPWQVLTLLSMIICLGLTLRTLPSSLFGNGRWWVGKPLSVEDHVHQLSHFLALTLHPQSVSDHNFLSWGPCKVPGWSWASVFANWKAYIDKG